MPVPPPNLGSTISTAVKPLYDCFIEHATYLFTAGRNVRDLQTNTQTLVGKRGDVEQVLAAGRQNGLVETNEARAWLKRADKAISYEEGNRQHYEQRCKIFGWCAPNCWSNYKISKKAAETLKEVNWCSEHKPTNVTQEPPPQPVEHIQVDSVSLKASQISILNQALRYIKDNDDNVGLVGIWGPRKVGKTLLLKMINNSFGASTDTSADPTHPSSSTSEQTGDIVDHSTSEIIEEATNTGRSDRQESSFHFVIYVTTPINCTVKNIQSEILRRLKIQVQDGDSVTTQASKISGFLRNKSFLVLLDDLQNGLDLSTVGLPYPFGVHGQLKWKVVITTRSQNLCYNMNARVINAPGLEMGEALELFKESAGGENLDSVPNISAHIKDLVGILRVLPTELMSFGRDMRGKEDPRRWQDVIHVVKELIKIQDREANSLRERIDIKLKEDVKKLREESSYVRNKIELAKENGMVATNKAKIWLARADSIISASTAIYESERTGANWDICIAAAKLREVGECIDGGPSVSDIAQPPTVIHIPVHVSPLQKSQSSLVEQVHQHVIDDPDGITAIWGPVGVGKTLLLKMINNSFETENTLTPSSSNSGDPPFDFVIYLTAPKQSLEENIQSEIMQRLKMQDNGDLLLTRATRIYQFLEDKSFLVLLDGLQTYLDLGAVGLPPLGIQGKLKKKIVLTTRSPSLCAEMSASNTMKVSGLGMDEALQLFQQIVGYENLHSNPQTGEHAKNIVDELRARPSELIKFGMELRTIGDPKQREDVILNKKKFSQQPSRAKVFKEAMEYIKNEPVDVIGIWGLGGVGKTHLLKKIQDHLKNSLFDHVIFVTASKECSEEKIQDEIVKNLKLEEEGRSQKKS